MYTVIQCRLWIHSNDAMCGIGVGCDDVVTLIVIGLKCTYYIFYGYSRNNNKKTTHLQEMCGEALLQRPITFGQ